LGDKEFCISFSKWTFPNLFKLFSLCPFRTHTNTHALKHATRDTHTDTANV